MRSQLYIFVLLLCCQISHAQLKKWSFPEAETASRDDPKPFVIYMYTSWCKYCSLMQNTTFRDLETIELLNAKFYFIPFNAEGKNDILFNRHIFRFNASGNNAGVHQLAASLADDPSRPAFPSVIILDGKYDILYRSEQYLSPETLRTVLNEIQAKD